MGSKQLSVIIKAVDQATQPLRAAANAAAAVGARISAGVSGLAGRVAGLGKHLFNVRGLVAAVGAAFAAWRGLESLNSAAEEVDKIGKAAARLGTSVEEMSALRYTASQAGVDFETLAKGMAKVEKNAAEFARTGGGSAAEAFRRLNVPITDTAGKVRNINQLLPELITAIQAAGGEAEQVNLAEAIFGRGSGEGFLNILKESPRLFEDLALKTEEARRLGVLFTDSQFEKLRAYGDAVDRIGQAWLGLRVRVLEKIGPDLVRIYDRISSVIAALPEMLGKLTANISKALEDSAEGRTARAKFRELASSLQDLLSTAIGGAAFVGFDLFSRLARVAFDGLGRDALSRGARVVRDFFLGMAQESGRIATRALANAGGIGSAAGALVAQVDGVFDGIRAMLVAADNLEASGTNGPADLFHAMKVELDATAPAAAMVADQIGAVTDKFMAGLNDVVGFSDALAKTSLEAIKLNDVLARTPPPVPATRTQWDGFVAGLKAGFQSIREQLAGFNGAMQLGRDVAQQFADSLAGGLASALVDSVGNFRNFGKAVRQVLSNVAKEISNMILKFLLLRAISGIAGSVIGPSNTDLLTSGAPGLKRGGWAKPLHAAGGAWVPGPNISRDVIPAILAPGERVLSRGEVAGMGGVAAVDRMARGGAPGGDTYNVTMNISTTGSASDQRQLFAALDAWWRDRTRNRPGFREALV